MTQPRVIALLVAVLLLAATPASAQTQGFVGLADATALEISVDGEGLVFSVTEAAVQSGPTDELASGPLCDAEDQACGIAEAILGVTGAAEAGAPAGEPEADETGGEIPEPLDQLLSAELGVARASASTDPRLGTGTSGEAFLALTATETILDETPLGDVADQIKDGLDQLLDPLAEQDPTQEIGPRLKGLIDLVFANLGDAPFATIDLGPTVSEATHDGGVTTVASGSEGAVVTLVPAPDTGDFADLAPDGLAQVIVGEAAARASTDGADGEAASSAAPVTLRLFDPVAAAEGGDAYQEIEIDPGVLECSPAELAPLGICVSLGGVREDVEGASAFAAGDAVAVTIFDDEVFGEDVPEIRIALASARAQVNAVTPEPEPEPEPPAPRRDLPATGAGAALPAVLLLGAGALGLRALRPAQRYRSAGRRRSGLSA